MDTQKLKQFQILLASILSGTTTCLDHVPTNMASVETETVIGQLEDPIARSLYSLGEQLDDFKEDYMTAHGLGDIQALKKISFLELQKHEDYLSRIDQLSSAVDTLFWFMVLVAVPDRDLDKSHIGIAKDWLITLSDRTPKLPLVVLLRTLAGA